MKVFVCMLLGACIIAYCIYQFVIKKADRVKMNSNNLRRDAHITDFSCKYAGYRSGYFITKVTFDDGFVFEARDTITENHFGYFSYKVTPEMKQKMIERAIETHEKAADLAGVPQPQKPFVCGKCNNRGPYEGNCPICGSSLRRYI